MITDPGHCTAQRWLSIIGIGEDGVEGLSSVARGLVSNAHLVVGGARHLALAQDIISCETLVWPSPLTEALDAIEQLRGRPVAVLASGDPFHFGIGRQLVTRFGTDSFLAIPQPSAFSHAAARMGWSLQDTAQVSLHGRALEGIIRHLHPGARILALSWDRSTPGKLARLLVERGMGGSSLTVLSAMGGPRETRFTGIAEDFPATGYDDLNTIALEVRTGPEALLVPFSTGLDDDLFEHDGQLTKRDVRAITLSALAPRQGELLWDIGLGAGSVAIEWLLHHHTLAAIGIEERQDRAARARRNAAALGTPDLRIVEGRAPEAMAGLPPPDAVFIGGGMSDDGVFEAAWSALKPGGRLVANAVSLETEARFVGLHERFGGELIRVQIARAEKVGTMTGWRPAMPITQWRVTKT